MHLLLTDRLTCPRCGPSFGLILRADTLRSRRVHDGLLGCPNCRDGFPIVDGFADLRAPPRTDAHEGLAGAPPGADGAGGGGGEEPERLRALLGVARGPGTVALVGEPARWAAPLAAAAEDLQVVGVDADLVGWPDAPGVSRLIAGPGLPFFTGMLRGAAVDGRLDPSWLAEAARVVAPGARVVVTRASPDAVRVLEDAGLHVVAAEAETVVATRG